MQTVLVYVLVAILYLAGSVAGREAGWEATLRLLRFRPGVGRAALIAVAEAFVGLGTGALALMVGIWLVPAHVFTLTLAATVGIAIGVYRQLDALRDEAVLHAAVHKATENQRAGRAALIGKALWREVAFGGASRVIGAVAVLIGVIAESFT